MISDISNENHLHGNGITSVWIVHFYFPLNVHSYSIIYKREHDQLEKFRESEQSDDDADDTSSVTDDEDKQDDTAVKHSSFPHSYSGGN